MFYYNTKSEKSQELFKKTAKHENVFLKYAIPYFLILTNSFVFDILDVVVHIFFTFYTEGHMTAFLSFLLFIISTVQSIIGFTLIFTFSSMMESMGGSALFYGAFLIFLEFILALIVTKIRDYSNFFVIFVEVVISPIAVVRYLIGLLLLVLLKKEYNLKSSNEEALGAVIGYLFYVTLSDESSITRMGNFFTMLLLAFPMACMMTYSFWINFGLYDFCLENYGVTLWKPSLLLCLLMILFFGGGLSTIRKQAVTVTTFNASYKFENRYTGAKKKMYSNDYLSLTDKSIDYGWRKVRGGDEEHLTLNTILTLVCSPILAFTYLVGLAFAFLSLLIGPIYSCVGSIDYDDVPLGIVQRVPHFLFAFVIVPGLKIFRGSRERSRGSRSYSSRGMSVDFSSLDSCAGFLTLVAAGLGILYFIFAQFHVMEHLSFNCFPNWLFELSTSYFLTGAIGRMFADKGFFMVILLVVLIVISAILEFLLMLLAWILGIALTLAAFLLQAAYIWLIPLALLPGTIFLYVRTFRDLGPLAKVGRILLIVLILLCVIKYGGYTIGAMFPDK